jgi:hypothetical protein
MIFMYLVESNQSDCRFRPGYSNPTTGVPMKYSHLQIKQKIHLLKRYAPKIVDRRALNPPNITGSITTIC